MAVKINGTIVADLNSSGDSVDFVNITDATGTYDNLRAFTPNIGDVGGPANDTLDFNFSSCSESMTANHTYTEANKSAGRVLLLSLNRNPSGTAYTPAFSANIKWPNDTEPTWSDYNNWLICLVCWDSTTVRATASGFGTGTVAETVTLSGTPSSYNSVFGVTQNGVDSLAGWRFKSDGTVFKTNVSGSSYNIQFNAGTEWCNVTPSQTYYLRCTVQAGSLDGGSQPANTWLALTTDRTFQVLDDIADGTDITVQIKIEIASDSGGSNILATGYYEATATQESQ